MVAVGALLAAAPAVAQQPATESTLARLAPWAATVIAQRDQPASVYAGVAYPRARIATIPFRYLRPLRLDGDVSEHIFGTLVMAPKGALGFDAGIFGETQVRMRCFFSNGRGAKLFWSYPVCYTFDSDDAPRGQSVTPAGNVPTSAIYQDKDPMYTLAPVEAGDFDFGHDFELVLSFQKWQDGGALLKWQSDGADVDNPFVAPAAADGTVSLPVNDGHLVLSPVPGNKKAAQVTFVPA